MMRKPYFRPLFLAVFLLLPLGHTANAQSNDAAFRINELEEQVRRLNGRVEELNFLLLQLQEQVRRMQQDNELRFQELEERNGSLEPADRKEDVARADTDSLEKPEPSGVSPSDGTTTKTIANETQAPAPPKARGPRLLGTLTFDKDGNVLEASPTDNGEGNLPGVLDDATEGAIDAAQFGATPNEVFAVGKTAFERKRFKRAEAAFRAHLKAWPEDPRMPEVRFYLGRSLFGQRQYYNAANIFLDTHNAHADAPTAADNLLNLGLALAGLNQREVACATYGEVLKQYPDAAERLGPQLEAEQASAQC